jgi:hypothetical protein
MPLTQDDDEDFDAFMARVDEVGKTLEGLKSGTIDPHELTKKERELKAAQEADEERKKQRKLAQERAKMEKIDAETRKRLGFVGGFCRKCKEERRECGATCPICGDNLLTEEERRDQIQGKVDEMKEWYVEQQKAREKWIKWRDRNPKKQLGGRQKTLQGEGSHGTNYDAWDQWAPSDDEEEREWLASLPPPENHEGLKAMVPRYNITSSNHAMIQLVSHTL